MPNTMVKRLSIGLAFLVLVGGAVAFLGLDLALIKSLPQWGIDNFTQALFGGQQSSSSDHSTMYKARVCVVGSGLAGLSAAIEAARLDPEHVEVVVLEKMANVGGNSAKASSGINALTPANGDTEELYSSDTTTSGGGLSKPDLISTLVGDSLDGLRFLESTGLDLSRVTRLGGHSIARSHSNPVGPNVGLAIIKAVSAAAKEISNINIITSAQVTGIHRADKGFKVQYHSSSVDGNGDSSTKELFFDAVVLATGGFAASRDMLQKYNSYAAAFATTNGEWATGDGIELGTSLGGALRDMEQVQIHPTGFVDPSHPEAMTKWLAPERLRGCGGILLNQEGHRFVDELQRRDVVTNATMAQPSASAWLVMGHGSAEEYGSKALDFYAVKHMMVKANSVEEAAQHMGISEEAFRQEVEKYNGACDDQKDEFGRAVFPHKVDLTQTMYIARVTPVVHYCMGGLEINSKGQVLGSGSLEPLPGVYAAGEVSGGLHGRNRLGGNSLAECVVYGRRAGRNAGEFAKQCHVQSVDSSVAVEASL